MGFPDTVAKNPPATMQEMRVRFLGREDPLEEEMAAHSSILAWRIPRTEEPGGLQLTGLQRVGRDRAAECVRALTHTLTHTHTHTIHSCLGRRLVLSESADLF